MPNWCSNYIKLKGPTQTLQRIEDHLSGNRIIKPSSRVRWVDMKDPPYTQEELDEAKKGELLREGLCFFGRLLTYEELKEKENEYEGNETVADIGTKWDPSYCIETIDEGTLEVALDSAWSPPARGIVLAARKYNINVEMTFEEGGCDFGGILIYDSLTDTVREGWASYFGFRYLKEWRSDALTACENARQDIEEFMKNDYDISELDEDLLENVQTVLKETQNIAEVSDLLGERVPAEQWLRMS